MMLYLRHLVTVAIACLLLTLGCASAAAPASPDAQSGWEMDADGRVNLLLVGADSRSPDGVDEDGTRTDSLILLTIDASTARAALFTFPRNMVNAPLTGVANPGAYEDDRLPEFLGYLWVRAAENPDRFPGSEHLDAQQCRAAFDCERAWRAVAGSIQVMAGVPLDGLVAVNLNGFVDLVDNLPNGGLWLDVPERLVDAAYYNSDRQLMPLDIEPGCQFLDGELTLAFARSRHQDSDFERTRRQQYVLQQIRRQVDFLGLLPHVSALLAVARANIYTTIAQADLPHLAELVDRIDPDRVQRFIFDPNSIAALGGFEGVPDKVRDIFDEPEPEPGRPDDEACPARAQ